MILLIKFGGKKRTSSFQKMLTLSPLFARALVGLQFEANREKSINRENHKTCSIV